MSPQEINFLKQKAKEIRKQILLMLYEAGSGHTGGSLSCVEILTTLFFKILKHNPKKPDWNLRDRFVLSKGHGCPALYATYAECGYFPKELLLTLRKLNSPLQGHPSRKHLPILEVSTGSLGQGLSVGLGIALGCRLNKWDSRVYVLMSDGENDEGQTWESAMASSHFKVDNITAIIDYNKFQLDGAVKNIMSLEPLSKKWEAFGWDVQEIDGHNFEQIYNAINKAKLVENKPQLIIAHTIKGKGVSFMENNNDFHGRAPKKDELEKALAEIEKDEF